MKNIFTLVLISIILTSNGFTQSSKIPSVPLRLLQHSYMPSSYIALDGTKHSGEIKFDETYTNYIWYKAEGKLKGIKVLAKNIKSYNYNNKTEYISLKGHFYSKVNAENQIELYTRFETKKGVVGATIIGSNVSGEYKYWVTIKNVIEFKSLEDASFLPFHKKVSPLIEYCPELAEKVAKKQKGYKKTCKTPQLNIWKVIATEYETCN